MRQREYLLAACISLVPHLEVCFWREEISCITSFQTLATLASLWHTAETSWGCLFSLRSPCPPHWSVLDKTFKNHCFDSSSRPSSPGFLVCKHSSWNVGYFIQGKCLSLLSSQAEMGTSQRGGSLTWGDDWKLRYSLPRGRGWLIHG